MTRFDDSFAPIAVATRSGYDESLFHGAAVAIDAHGAILSAVGDPTVPVYPRSSLKPLQAMAMADIGLDLPDDLLAIVCASHDGSAIHLDAVRRILDRYDLDVDDLQNTAAWPLDDDERQGAIRAGTEPSSLQQNCSGKHAGMLATCRISGWSITDYLDADHPLQKAITTFIESHGGGVRHVGIDGCGAPTHVLALDGLARSFADLALRSTDAARAMVARPDLVGGPSRDVTLWMCAVPGLIAKDGADGVMAGALPDGRAFALKVAGGSDLARQAATAQALRELGVDVDGAAETVARTRVDVLGHGNVVGHVEAIEWTPWSS